MGGRQIFQPVVVVLVTVCVDPSFILYVIVSTVVVLPLTVFEDFEVCLEMYPAGSFALPPLEKSCYACFILICWAFWFWLSMSNFICWNFFSN